jgi:hypothetical protein
MKVPKSQVATGIGVEFQDFGTSGARGLRGVSLNYRRCKVVRDESSCECLVHPSGGDCKGDRWHVLAHRGVNP